ncbi:MAG: PEP-CTERM sorting domain-containing protein [Planctomycetota bacterium]|nr:MAG: PEP-CTERM sorting domain-containing protein [Planctomycetota bacterium]
MLSATTAHGQSFSEDFNSVPMLTGAGWVMQNNSQALGTTGWFQGNTIEFSAFDGPANSYVAANFENAGNGAGQDTISNWLISPLRTFSNGDILSFYTRSATNQISSVFVDRLQVRFSSAGASTNVGNSATSTGDFTQLLLDINAQYGVGTQYPSIWTYYEITFSGLPGPTSGRFAFRYFVEDGGPAGDRSNYIGIDSLVYTQIPEPGALALFAVSGFLIPRRRRRRA